jgi:hypothetical protein
MALDSGDMNLRKSMFTAGVLGGVRVLEKARLVLIKRTRWNVGPLITQA